MPLEPNPLVTSPITLVVLADDCGNHASVPGHVHEGELIPCPSGDHEHYVQMAFPTEVVENITITTGD